MIRLKLNIGKKKALFETKTGEWRSPHEIITDKDPLYCLYPEKYQLAEGYGEQAVEFIFGCRSEPTAGKEAEMLFNASTPEQRKAAEEYILSMDSIPKELITLLKQDRKRENWLNNHSNPQILELLGSRSNAEIPPHSQEKKSKKPIRNINDLHTIVDWWKEEGESHLRQYEQKIYGKYVPNLSEYNPNCARSRADWFSIFMLGSFQRMGRQKPEQHRAFIERCHEEGWIEHFSSDNDKKNWLMPLNGFLDDNSGYLQYYYWMNNFLSYYQFGRKLDEYSQLLLQLADTEARYLKRDIKDILALSRRGDYSGSGMEAPPLYQALGIGAHFVIREVLRQQPNPASLKTELVQHAYTPSKSMVEFMNELGIAGIKEKPETIYHAIQKELKDEAIFDGAFDIPLQLIASDAHLQNKVLGKFFNYTMQAEEDF